ncbi:hypothetical protein ACMGD3_21640 [Lysinibacillus sphaericus]|uniref:hypothetical protein n=1 Tax=Lysinibacillus sphaericus TaxID=1421 RepID=UPI003F7A4DCF
MVKIRFAFSGQGMSRIWATNVLCAKAKRQQQVFYVRKRSVSNRMMVTEGVATPKK